MLIVCLTFLSVSHGQFTDKITTWIKCWSEVTGVYLHNDHWFYFFNWFVEG